MKLFNTEYRIQDTRYRFRGFTLLEIIIVIAITATMATIGIGYYANISKTKLLDKTAEEIVAYLKYAQQNSIVQKDGKQWGVHFENPSSGADFYALYTGTTYSSPIEIKYLPEGIEFSIPQTASSADISFSKLTGLLSTGGYKQIILKEISTNQTKNVLSCYQGLISYNIDISVCG
ncbi:MAG TPA: prepilin-type N-terminal cleavage/methylation domain-containing protein, partial [Candidatus Paceibacterota bacterium]|nr:prepilin-type N-terminal cleavage/methylation domain-containing protein [Candidatus Paceibacterota bacterium]